MPAIAAWQTLMYSTRSQPHAPVPRPSQLVGRGWHVPTASHMPMGVAQYSAGPHGGEHPSTAGHVPVAATPVSAREATHLLS